MNLNFKMKVNIFQYHNKVIVYDKMNFKLAKESF